MDTFDAFTTAHLKTLPTETLAAIAALTHEMRAQQFMRSLTDDMLKALRAESHRRGNTALCDRVNDELTARARAQQLTRSLAAWE